MVRRRVAFYMCAGIIICCWVIVGQPRIYRKYEIGSRKYSEAVKKAEKLFLRFSHLSITPEVAIRASKIGTALMSRGEEIGINDTYIAATALVHDLTLVTTDVAHFNRITELTVDEW